MVFETMYTVYPKKMVFVTKTQVLPSLTVFETILSVLPILNVFVTLSEVLPILAVFETMISVLPIKNVSEAINHVSPKFLVPLAETKTYVLSPKNDSFFAFLGDYGMIELVPTKHVENREFSDSAQFHSLIGSPGLHLLVSGVYSRECVLVGTPLMDAALRCLYQQLVAGRGRPVS